MSDLDDLESLAIDPYAKPGKATSPKKRAAFIALRKLAGTKGARMTALARTAKKGLLTGGH